jgi:hypothetical protein
MLPLERCGSVSGEGIGRVAQCSLIVQRGWYDVLHEAGFEERLSSSWQLRDQIAEPRARSFQLAPRHVPKWEVATEHDAEHRVKPKEVLAGLSGCGSLSVPLDDVIAKRAQALGRERQTMIVFVGFLR